MDAESIQKTFNVTTTNSILIKLATDIYFNKVFHLPKSWGITHKVQDGINKISQKDLGPNFDHFLILQ